MNEKISELILQWHHVYVSLTESIEHARVVLDQSDRGTLLPDRVREMRGHLIRVRERIPKLANLLEELIDETVWPMKVEGIAAEGLDGSAEPVEEKTEVTEAEAAAEMAFDDANKPEETAEVARSEATAPGITADGDYTADGSTPGAHEVVDEEAAAEEVSEEDDALGDPDDTGTS